MSALSGPAGRPEDFNALISFLTVKQGAYLDVDDLLPLHYFRRRHEAHWAELREAYPYDGRRLGERLAALETNLLMIEHSGGGPGMVCRLSRRAAAILNRATSTDLTGRPHREAIKARVLTLLKDRLKSNEDVRAVTDPGRKQVNAVLKELGSDGQVRLEGHGAGARWHLGPKN